MAKSSHRSTSTGQLFHILKGNRIHGGDGLYGMANTLRDTNETDIYRVEPSPPFILHKLNALDTAWDTVDSQSE